MSDKTPPSDPFVPMEIRGLMMDPTSNVPIVILRNEESARFLPIWIGVAEANAIALKLEGVDLPRPMTHDLAIGLIQGLGGTILRVVITDLVDGTFFARIVLQSDGGEEREVDSRPSDAMALALRAGVEILVAEIVLEKAKTDEATERLTDEEKVKRYLEELDEEDIEYTM